MKNLLLQYIGSFLVFGLGMGALFTFQTGSAATGFAMGLLGGVLFTTFIAIFRFVAKRFRVLGMKEVEGWAPGEVVLRMGDANMMRHGLAEGGRLFLTAMRLRFYAHRAGLEVGDLSFPLTSVSSVERCRTLGVVPNGLRVILTDGRKAQFVVDSPSDWIQAITRTGALPRPPRSAA